ncbi:MAG: aminomethyl transferase family protein [Phycisphaerales bacterium]|nr:aminomethyl transferase family protein [Phycisphaerales bacterium]
MTSASFHAESLLRAQHDAFAAGESARRAAHVQEERGIAGIAHRSHIQWVPWGNTAEIVGLFDRVETEYSAIRSGVALCDQPQRGTIEVTGSDRIAFLQRMCTQDLKSLSSGQSRRSFWLNRKGRIESDLLICDVGDRLLIDCAGAFAAPTVEALTKFIFSEDVAVSDRSGRDYRIALHGPHALQLLESVGANASAVEQLSHPCACLWTTVAGVPCVLVRADLCATVGIECFVARENLVTLWNALLGAHDVLHGARRRARPCGWHAFNMARIEGGSPLFEIDFATASLPHETGLLGKRVSFTKGCYLGQEVVARMESLGKPKQIVRAFRMESSALPTSGTPVLAVGADGAGGEEIGVVTSSAMSPMLGAACIGFATVRFNASAVGTPIIVRAEGANHRALLQGELAFVRDPHTPSATGGTP